MLDIVNLYAHKWRYLLNDIKSVVMVFDEASQTRLRERERRLGDSLLQEVDEQHHLDIFRSMTHLSVCRTNERATAGRSAFFALNLVVWEFAPL